MKKLDYLFGALALAGFLACSNNEEVANVEVIQQRAQTYMPIGFSPLTKGATRSTLINKTADITSFLVRGTWGADASTKLAGAPAGYTDKVWIEGRQVTLGGTDGPAMPSEGAVYGGFGSGIEIVNSSGWNYKNSDQMQFWPYYATGATSTGEGESAVTTINGYACLPLDFYAVTPANAGIGLEPSSQFTYTGAEVANMVDICYAVAKNQTKSPVEMKFNHIFSQVIVKCKKADNYTVDIKNVTIGGVKPGGTLAMASVKDFSGNVQWGTTSGDVRTYPVYSSAAPFAVPNSAASESPVTMTPSGQELLLVPQSITKWDLSKPIFPATEGAEVTKQGYIAITYRAKKSDAASWTTASTEDGYTTTYFPLQTKWVMGKVYAYTLLFGGVADPDAPTTPDPENPNPGTGDDNPGGYDENGNAKAPSVPITFTATVTDWEKQVVDISL